ncbi:hypothetical protein TSUD_352610 [Trifolium subterraneum]|nr:hypothetical protein TSUD_352610 [Trifolium subterraneum]
MQPMIVVDASEKSPHEANSESSGGIIKKRKNLVDVLNRLATNSKRQLSGGFEMGLGVDDVHFHQWLNGPVL